MSRRGGKSAAPTKSAVRRASDDFKEAYVGSVDSEGYVPVIVVVPQRATETAITVVLQLWGDQCIRSASTRDEVEREQLFEGFNSKLFAKCPADCAAHLVAEAATRSKQTLAPEVQDILKLFLRYPQDSLPTAAALVSSGGEGGVSEDGSSPSILGLLLETGEEYRQLSVTAVVDAAHIARPASYATRSQWTQQEHERWIGVVAMQIATPELLTQIQAIALHMARYHSWREEHSCARVLAQAAQHKEAKTNPLLQALLGRAFAGIDIELPAKAATGAGAASTTGAKSATSTAATGSMAAPTTDACAVCGSKSNLSLCAGCKSVAYCSRDHQKEHWSTHKTVCKTLSKK